jgi:hypothetical protein
MYAPGFPLAYEGFDGHRTDVTTLDDILQAVEATDGQAQRVWVLDRGIVSEKNLATWMFGAVGYPCSPSACRQAASLRTGISTTTTSTT